LSTRGQSRAVLVEHTAALVVITGLDPVTHAFLFGAGDRVDTRVKPAHDE
jgi:hypothetical protein